jgi:hypothetical protein
VWEYDLPARNARFLEGLDVKYFEYLGSAHVAQFDGEQEARAAVGLRSAYHHSLETLFSLLGALTQAPECVPAWLPKCSNDALREVVSMLQRGDDILTQRGRQPITFGSLAAAVHQYAWQNDQPLRATSERFGLLWQRLADDFLDPYHIAEYNSIKHGFRVAAGGFGLSIGLEHVSGVSPPDEEMKTIGYSPFGTTFFAVEPVPVGNHPKNRSFRVRRMSLNWRAEAMVQRLQLIQMSIGNVVGALRIMNGSAPGTILFHRPEDPSAFETAWNWSVGVTSINMDTLIEASDVAPTSTDELLRELEARGSRGAY